MNFEEVKRLLKALEDIAEAFHEQNRQNAAWIAYVKERDNAIVEREKYLDAKAEQWREEDIQRGKEAAERLERNTQAMHEQHAREIEAAFEAGKLSLSLELVKEHRERTQ